MLWYLLAAVVVAGIIVFFIVWAKRTGKECEELVAGVSEENKNRLSQADVVFEGGKNEWTQEALIAKVIDKGSKADLKLVWYNKTLQQTNYYNQLTMADVTVKKEELESHGLKEGSFVKMHIAPEKSIGSVTLKYDE